MSEWKPGDLARCIDVRDIRLPFRTVVAQGGKFLVTGMVYIVQEVGKVYETEDALDVGVKYGFKLASRFVKVPPLEDSSLEDAREREHVDG